MTDEQIDRREFKRLRNYYRNNFVNGVSDESFMTWCENMLKRINDSTETNSDFPPMQEQSVKLCNELCA